jgi:hypothetical protein
MPPAATLENVASPHCSDERELNLQKAEPGDGGMAKY